MRYLLLTSLFFLSSAVSPQTARAEFRPTLQEAEAGMKKMIAVKIKREKADAEVQKAAAAFKLRAVNACFPANQRPNGDFVCSVEATGRSGGWVEDQVPFKFQNGKWEVLDLEEGEEFDPACPSLSEAEQQLRLLKKSPALKVKNDVGEGVGEITNDRGMNRDQKGAWRMMCRYDVEPAPGQSDQLMVAYVDFVDGKYSFEPVVEVWEQ